MITNMESMSGASILRTLIYAAVFGAGIKKSYLHKWLISPAPVERGELEKKLKQLIKQKRISQNEDWLFLGKVVKESQSRFQESHEKLEFARHRLRLVTWLPTLSAIAVTGSVAALNATASEDIDLMIVTKTGFLWITRACVSLILFMDGSLRRRLERQVANKFCLNLWLDESSLQLPKQSLYVARELAQAEWILDKSQVEGNTWQANPWTREYLGRVRKRVKTKTLFFYKLVAWVFSPLEFTCFQFQFLRMRLTREIVARDKAFFHPRNTQSQVLSHYRKLCRRYNVESLI